MFVDKKTDIFMSMLFFCISKNKNCFPVCYNGVFFWFSIHNKDLLKLLKNKVCIKYLTFVKLT